MQTFKKAITISAIAAFALGLTACGSEEPAAPAAPEVEATAPAMDEAASSTEDMASDAMEAVEEAADDATEAVEDVLEDAEDALEEAVDDAEDAASDMMDAMKAE